MQHQHDAQVLEPLCPKMLPTKFRSKAVQHSSAKVPKKQCRHAGLRVGRNSPDCRSLGLQSLFNTFL